MVADVKGRKLYELDVARLQRLDALVALLHGPSHDDGVGFELGFAAAHSIPIAVCSSDFQTYGLGPDGAELMFPDPLIEAIATATLRSTHTNTASTSKGSDRYESFAADNQRESARFVQDAAELTLSLLGRPARLRKLQREKAGDPFILVEATPYADPGPLHAWLENAARCGVSIAATKRRRRPDYRHGQLLDGAVEDLHLLARADAFVVDVSGPETPLGGAVLMGAANAMGIPVIAWSSRNAWTFAAGREPNYRNLMIQYSSVQATDADDAADLLEELDVLK